MKHLDNGPKQIITQAMFKKEVSPGDLIMKQGDDGDNFYIIDGKICPLSLRRLWSQHVAQVKSCREPMLIPRLRADGTADVYVKGIDALTPEDDGAQTHDQYGGRVQVCGPGDSFGELALMYTAPRAATIIARCGFRPFGSRTVHADVSIGDTIKTRVDQTTIKFGRKKKSALDLESIQFARRRSGREILSSGTRCRTNMVLWGVDRQTFRTMIMSTTITKRNKQSDWIQKCPLLQSLMQVGWQLRVKHLRLSNACGSVH